MIQRIIQPELLETLANEDPDAVLGRRDLRIVNLVMGNHRWITRVLRRHYRPGWRITELGAGDGALSMHLCRSKLCRAEDLHAFDLVGRPAHWPPQAQWTQGDLLEQPLPHSEVLVVNLLLHQFQDAQLRRLGSRIPPTTRLIVAAEPARSPAHAVLGRLLCAAARFHPITRHDMQVSIRAGFRHDELAKALALEPGWTTSSATTPFGAYHFVAFR
ncbi:MAG: hypothetical protein U0984_07930 [Prosthecobacter sp.]|nr:hypothetical protein [Prosthecobacter sp.]